MAHGGARRVSEPRLAGNLRHGAVDMGRPANARRRASAQPYATRSRALIGWLRTFEPATVPDAAAIVLGLERATDAAACPSVHARWTFFDAASPGRAAGAPTPTRRRNRSTPRSRCWPCPRSGRCAGHTRAYPANARGAAIARGRQFLIDRQLPDGSWPETTRPSGQESYAQRISTAGWATLALLEKKP